MLHHRFHQRGVVLSAIRSFMYFAVLCSATVLSAQGKENDEKPLVDHHMVLVTGEDHPDLKPLDDLMISMLKKHHVPGAALAVVRDGRLVYARGFGFSNLEDHSPVLPTSLFRIASISKPITATAIMQLVDQDKLDLEERVFDILQYEPHFEGDRNEVDPRMSEITVRQLLQHTGGWDRDKSFDAMFQSVRIARSLGLTPPAEPDAVIRFMLGIPLDFAPGERYAYSNYGYCLLGRIIEKKTGENYEQYVQQHVFAPLSIHRPRIGRTRDSGSLEVRYYDARAGEGKSVFGDNIDEKVPSPYGAWYLEAMDAHGGWLASAVDLVRFSVAVHNGSQGGLISDESVAQMFTRPAGLAGFEKDGAPRDVYYGLGWSIRPAGAAGGFNSWHTGSLPGTSTILVRRHDNMHWAVLFNTRHAHGGGQLAGLIDPLVHSAVDAVQQWPEDDQFPRYLHPQSQPPQNQ